jgi:cell division protein FtsI/penicillin-binding protein 2
LKEKYQTKLDWIIVITLGVFIASLLALFLLFNIRQQLLQIQQNPSHQNTTINKESQDKDIKDTPPESTEEEANKFGVWEIQREEFEELFRKKEEYDRKEEELRKIIEQRKQEIEKHKNSQVRP